jgi:hypothetical protein
MHNHKHDSPLSHSDRHAHAQGLDTYAGMAVLKAIVAWPQKESQLAPCTWKSAQSCSSVLALEATLSLVGLHPPVAIVSRKPSSYLTKRRRALSAGSPLRAVHASQRARPSKSSPPRSAHCRHIHKDHQSSITGSWMYADLHCTSQPMLMQAFTVIDRE